MLAVVALHCPWHRNCIILVFQLSFRAGSLIQPLNEEMSLYKSAPHPRTRRNRIAGFSMVEMAISLTVLMILTAIAIPTLMRSLRTYQLNDAAARLSDLLKFTRFEAVRRNSLEYFDFNTSGPGWVLWTTPTNGSTSPAATEKQILITGFATLLPAGGSPGPPSPAAIATALGVSVSALNANTLSGSAGKVTFDARGAIRVGGSVSASVFVFYIGSATNPEFGYRAVIQLPSGSTQIWTAPNGGAWQQVS
jgi:type II secretory pathway pseudopilin PulG